MNLNLFSETTDDVAVDFPTSYQQIIERINRINPIQYSKTRNFYQRRCYLFITLHFKRCYFCKTVNGCGFTTRIQTLPD